MDLAVIVLCWRNEEHVPALLRSIASQKTAFAFEVVVCHNDEAPVPRLAPSDVPPGIAVHEIATGGNRGYGGGNNFAIAWVRRRAEPRYFLVLNSDVILHQDAIDAIVRWADAHPDVAAVGAVHDDPSRPGYRCYGGNRYNRAFSIIRRNATPGATRMDYVHGAAVLLRARDFPADGPFADHYFLFFEELDLAARLRAAGKAIGYCPGCRVSHFEGASRNRGHADVPPEVAEYFENLNALRFTRDHHPLFLPTALLFRVVGKAAWLCVRAQGSRLVFWALALADFSRGRVRRFPFQKGWQPRSGHDRVVDADWPGLLTRSRPG